MVDTYCGGCGRMLTDDEQLRFGWACSECEAEWQEELTKYDQRLQAGDQ